MDDSGYRRLVAGITNMFVARRRISRAEGSGLFTSICAAAEHVARQSRIHLPVAVRASLHTSQEFGLARQKRDGRHAIAVSGGGRAVDEHHVALLQIRDRDRRKILKHLLKIPAAPAPLPPARPRRPPLPSAPAALSSPACVSARGVCALAALLPLDSTRPASSPRRLLLSPSDAATSGVMRRSDDFGPIVIVRDFPVCSLRMVISFVAGLTAVMMPPTRWNAPEIISSAVKRFPSALLSPCART